MHRKALFAGVVMLLAAFGASSRPLETGSTTMPTAKLYCPELPADCCYIVMSGGCKMCRAYC